MAPDGVSHCISFEDSIFFKVYFKGTHCIILFWREERWLLCFLLNCLRRLVILWYVQYCPEVIFLLFLSTRWKIKVEIQLYFCFSQKRWQCSLSLHVFRQAVKYYFVYSCWHLSTTLASVLCSVCCPCLCPRGPTQGLAGCWGTSLLAPSWPGFSAWHHVQCAFACSSFPNWRNLFPTSLKHICPRNTTLGTEEIEKF